MCIGQVSNLVRDTWFISSLGLIQIIGNTYPHRHLFELKFIETSFFGPKYALILHNSYVCLKERNILTVFYVLQMSIIQTGF